jgi:glycosyltransferase involved in cell wall biosynthesis
VTLHGKNKGKGAAIRTAIPLATGEVCLIQDADLEYEPRDYPRLLKPILSGEADVVYGSRFLGRGKQKEQTIQHYLANKLLTFLSNSLTRLRLTDMETCYKVARTDLMQGLRLESNGFDIEPEITARLAGKMARFVEVPIAYHARSHGEGKKIGWRDGVHTLAAIFRYRRGH